MTSKRQLKKYLTETCGALAAECMIAEQYVDGIDCAAMDAIILDIARLQDHAVSRVSISFDKVPSDFDNGRAYSSARRAYFSDAFHRLVKEFDEKVADIIKAMNAQLPAAQREANKAAANA
ncbi:MAG: hypothetical protein NC342_07200 [Pseudoflavonifractor sp.]|nr:hypothetical protein [Alloprevotella sp.]MCM1117305.1 hypothetical protein [Pseudoflavonifractor sp.]